MHETTWNKTISDVNDAILVNMRRPHPSYYFAWFFAIGCMGIGGACLLYQITVGMGAAGMNHAVFWGCYITNFVFWVGIGLSLIHI